MMRLPPQDRVLSRYTGFTREHWECVADHWLMGIRDHASPGHAAVAMPGSQTSASGSGSDALEGFARSFLGAAARIAGSSDPRDFAGWYARGLDHGTRTGGVEEWGRAVPTDQFPSGICQPIVEASAIAFGLALCREQLWDQLDAGVQERLGDWLLHHARLSAWNNNWLLFTAITEAFLTSVGIDVPDGHGEEDVDRVESWYLGQGWYNDGDLRAGRNIDHYNSWVIHPYLWMWYHLRRDQVPAARLERFRQRLGQFVGNYARLFARNGAPLLQGRSLSYRTAVLAGPWAAGLEGVGPLEPGAVRRLASGTLRYFLDHGTRAPLTLGWFGEEYLPMVQPYSGPGSPYWAGIGFLGLAVPADHALWTEPEVPQPTDGDAAVAAWPEVGWLVSHDDQGVVKVANHGSDHVPAGSSGSPAYYAPFYSKFGHSSHTSPGLGPAWADGIDEHMALVDRWERATRRGQIRGVATGDAWAASWHVPELASRHLPGARVVSASVMRSGVEVRCHLITAPGGWRPREGGAAVTEELSATLIPLAGWGQATVRYSEYQRSTPLGGATRVPWIRFEDRIGDHGLDGHVIVSMHALTSGRDAIVAAPLRVRVNGSTVSLVWHSGESDELDLGKLFDWERSEEIR